jgi:hypothetical protein
MNATNSLLVDIEGLVDFDNMDGPLYPVSDTTPRSKERFSRPSCLSAAKQMRWAFDHQEAARAVGKVGREHIVRHFSREAVAQIVVDRVGEIEKELSGGVRAAAV